MSSKTKIVVLHLKEVVYTAIFAVLGILLVLLLIFMFLPDDKDKAAKETMKYTGETLSIALDISIYLGETVRKNYPNLYWGYRAKPKNEFSANRPVILKLVGKRAYFNPSRIVFVAMVKSSEAHDKSQLYDLYRYWEEEHFIPSKPQI